MPTFDQDLRDKLDYKFDFAPLTNATKKSNWLQSGETISSYVLTVPTGVTIPADSLTDANTSVTIWVDGDTAGTYEVECTITTSDGRILTKAITFIFS